MAVKKPNINPLNRGGVWYLSVRVPKKYEKIEPRKHVNWSTGLAVWQDPRAVRASRLVAEHYEILLATWENKFHGNQAHAPDQFFAAQKRAAELGLTYQPYNDLLNLDLGTLFKRFLVLANTLGMETVKKGVATPEMLNDIDAVLGTAPEPPKANSGLDPEKLTVADMLKEYERINASLLAKKSTNQMRKWRIARQSNLDLFLDIIGGNKPFSALTRKDAQDWRNHWQHRVESDGVRVNSANRYIRQVSGLYAAIKDYQLLDGPGIFDKIFIRGGEEGKRLAFEPDFVQSHYLADGMFDELNPEARRIIYLIIETGLRLSEACALNRKTIILDADIPYVDIQQFNRTTKTKESVRQIPLVGVALLAMKAQPDGFPRYFDNADSASALISKALTNRKLRPGGPLQTLYSMRHTIVDRLTAVEAPEIIKEDMLGHKHMYGKGSTLMHRHSWLQKIAFRPPSTI